MGDDDFIPTSRESYCENQGFGEVTCNVRGGCCKYDAAENEWFADNEESPACLMIIDNDMITDDDLITDDDMITDDDYIPTNRDLICGGFDLGSPSEEEYRTNLLGGDCCQYDSTENECFGNSDSLNDM